MTITKRVIDDALQLTLQEGDVLRVYSYKRFKPPDEPKLRSPGELPSVLERSAAQSAAWKKYVESCIADARSKFQEALKEKHG